MTITAEAAITDAVLARLSPDVPPRTRAVMTALVEHVHGFVRDISLTPEEWEQGIRFLTEIGKWCDDKRQEAILVSDVMGVSMLVDAIAHRTHLPVSESTVLGPFHRTGAPHVPNGADIAGGIAGEPLEVALKVTDEAGAPIAGAQVDVWHTSPEGFYDSQIGGGDEFAMRAVLTTDAAGFIRFRSIMPASYPVPHDGPAGSILGAMGRHPMRPAHVHFWIRRDGFRPLITQVFAAGDPYLDSDAVFGVKPSLVGDYGAARRADPGAPWRLDWTFSLPREDA